MNGRRHPVVIAATSLALLALVAAPFAAGVATRRAQDGVAVSGCDADGVPASGAVSTCDDGDVAHGVQARPGAVDAAAMRIYRDPATGEFTAPPVGAAEPETRAAGAAPATAIALDSSAATLVETPGTSAAGGVTMDLRGTLQSAITASAGGDGRVTARCAQRADGP